MNTKQNTAPPSETVMRNSTIIIQKLKKQGLAPLDILPSILGGISITYRRKDIEVYLEILNSEFNICTAMFKQHSEEYIEPTVTTFRIPEEVHLLGRCINIFSFLRLKELKKLIERKEEK